ncbi:MAG: hypothetical protein IPL96_08805 [Holophagaceae bacterium]|nr:hypothetical protein [Holophagaceae bacterium]
MGLFGNGKSKQEHISELEVRIHRLEAEVEALRAEKTELQELSHHQELDRELVLRVVEALQVGMDVKALGKAFCETVFRPLELASFYIAVIDRERSIMSFPTYHEGGALRVYADRDYKAEFGLTGRTVESGVPRYIRSADEGLAGGAVFSVAEQLSGLVPQSWYGVPFGFGEKHYGLVSYQCFQKDGFNESARRLMDALTVILALHFEMARR